VNDQLTEVHDGNALKQEEPKLLPPPGAKQEPPPPPKPGIFLRSRYFVSRHPIGTAMGIIAFAAVLIGGYFLLRYFNSYESTDDAEVEAHLDPIGSRISGLVTHVYVERDDAVKAGEVLVQLDPHDYQVAIDRARGAYAQAVAQFRAENPNVPITLTTTQSTVTTGESSVRAAEAAVSAAQHDYEAHLDQVRQTEAQNVKAQQDVLRYRSLVAKDEISRQQYDGAVAAADSEAAAVSAAKASADAARQALNQRQQQLAQAQAQLDTATTNAPREVAVRRAGVDTRLAMVQSARAELEQAELNLSYTKIVAPASGVIASRTVNIGESIQPGEQLVTISEVGDVWFIANFKETQLRRMRPGQDVDIHVDAFDETFKGYVAELPGASGAATSLLPPENATGNFVKVVQRLPVRILLKPGQDPQHRLRPGMSVEPKVWL
jgi:membrane fusion protein (multidrug efflux system)